VKSSPDVFLLPAHTHLNEVAWRDSIYLFDSFQAGRITFDTGFSPEQRLKLNYNLYFAQMDFINDDGDTLQIKPKKEIQLIEVDNNLFFYDPKVGYIQIVHRLPVALGAFHVLTIDYMEFATGKQASLEDARGTPSDYDRYYRKTMHFYFIGKDNKSHKAIPTSLYRLFRHHKNEIKGYIDENSIDFRKKDDLIKLLIFCNGLVQGN
jgi:hypothetical protein